LYRFCTRISNYCVAGHRNGREAGIYVRTQKRGQTFDISPPLTNWQLYANRK